MVHNDKNQLNLSVAHNRCEKSFINKSWKHMKFESSGFATGPKNKVFVKEAGTRDKGKGNTGAVYCFQFNLDLFDASFKAELIQMFKPPPLKPEIESTEPILSQDFPEIRVGNLLKCEICSFETPTTRLMRQHILESHEKCAACKKIFFDKTHLTLRLIFI